MFKTSLSRALALGATGFWLSVGVAGAAPVTTHSTDFEAFSLGSVNGQGGWGVSNPNFDQEVVDLSGNKVLRISNRFTSGTFSDQPFAPRPGGTGMSPSDPVNSQPGFFAGQGSTGASYNRFIGSFDVRSVATGATDTGARITVSPDNGNGARQGFIAFENTTAGVEVTTYNVNSGGGFVGPTPIATMGFGEWFNVRFEIDFYDGAMDDVVQIFINNTLAGTTTSWEQYYVVWQPTLHPLGVPVQTLLYRLSGTAVPQAQGFYIDNVVVQLDNRQTGVPEPASLALFGLALAGIGLVRRRRSG